MDYLDDNELREAAQRCADTYAEIANQKYARCSIPIPVKIDWALDKTHPKWAGSALGTAEIGINWIMYIYDPEQCLNETIPHEIAHLVEKQIFGTSSLTAHGAEWREIVKRFGKKPEKYHKIDIKLAKAAFDERQEKIDELNKMQNVAAVDDAFWG